MTCRGARPRIASRLSEGIGRSNEGLTRAELLALNGYTQDARNGGLPAVTAVDEAVIEPGVAAVRSYLAGLGQPLQYPVGLDETGRLADGYGVQDQPWLVLVSSSGKILWSHDGWLTLPALEAAVASRS